MSTSCSRCRPDCTVVGFVVSLVLGVVTAFLRITGEISLTSAFLWVLLGIAVLFLAVSLIAAAVFREDGCNNLCSVLTPFLIGVIGTVILSVLLLAFEFAATSVIGAILTGSLLFFFFLTVTFAACLTRCIFNCAE